MRVIAELSQDAIGAQDVILSLAVFGWVGSISRVGAEVRPVDEATGSLLSLDEAEFGSVLGPAVLSEEGFVANAALQRHLVFFNLEEIELVRPIMILLDLFVKAVADYLRFVCTVSTLLGLSLLS